MTKQSPSLGCKDDAARDVGGVGKATETTEEEKTTYILINQKNNYGKYH